MRRSSIVFASLLALFARATPAHADPLNSSSARSNSESEQKGEHNDFNVVPIVGGSTDIGIGGGHFAGLAHQKPGVDPYVWNLESASLFTVKGKPGGGVRVPYQDLWFKLTIPQFLGRALRLEIRPSYTWEVLRYYGLGNASVDETRNGASTAFTEYDRLHPQLDVDVRWRIFDHFAGHVGVRTTLNWLQTNDDSRLIHDMREGSAEVRRLLGSADAHAVVLFKYGVQWDDRDEETSPHSGQHHTIDVKMSPGGTHAVPYHYGVIEGAFSGFVPISKPSVTLALRVVFSGLVGDPPFYELARYADTYALGGGMGVRGIPAQRYHGKVKLFGNLELRTELFSFHLFKKPMIFGLAAFFDAGRLWTDWHPTPELDGTGVGLKYGTGLGFRIQSGSAFVVRGDVAWSPDATPIGGYFSAGQVF